MKPLIAFALWVVVGWDLGAWGQALLGIPAVIGILAGIAVGAAFAVVAHRQIASTGASHEPRVAAKISSFDEASVLERAA
jgi:hypothetical protein